MIIATFEVPIMKMNRDNQTADVYLYFIGNTHISLLRKYTEYVKDKSTDRWVPIEMAEWNLDIEINSNDFAPIDINFSIPSSSKELKMKNIKSVEKPLDDGSIIKFQVYGLYTSDQEDS